MISAGRATGLSSPALAPAGSVGKPLRRCPVRESLRAAELHVDLGAVTYIDSSGIGALIVTRRQAEFRGVTMTFERLAPVVHDALARAGLLSSFVPHEADRHLDGCQL